MSYGVWRAAEIETATARARRTLLVLSFSEDPKVVWIGRPMDESHWVRSVSEGGTFFSEEWERVMSLSLCLFFEELLICWRDRPGQVRLLGCY